MPKYRGRVAYKVWKPQYVRVRRPTAKRLFRIQPGPRFSATPVVRPNPNIIRVVTTPSQRAALAAQDAAMYAMYKK